MKWLEKALNLAGEAKATTAVHSKAIHALGWMAFIQGDWSRARPLYLKSLALFRKLGGRQGEGIALADLGVVERWLGDNSLGTEHCEEAVRIAREVQDPLRLAITLIWAYATTGGKFIGRAPRAELEEAVELSRRLGNLWGIYHALNGLGDLFRELGEYREARVRYEEALRGFRELKDRWMTAWTLEGIGRASFLDGDSVKAQGYFKESTTLFDLLGDEANVVFLLRRLAMAVRSQGRHSRAATLLGAFKALQEAIISPAGGSQIEYSPALSAAFAEYRADYAKEWTQGQTMTLEQAVRYALEDSNE